MATQLNYSNISSKQVVKHNHNNHLMMGIAAVLLSTSLFAGIGVSANADAATPTTSTQLSNDSYTLPAPNDEGTVIEQQISQNVSRSVNVNQANGSTQTQTQLGTATGSQLYDQAHGVVLEGHVNPVVWHSVSSSATKVNNSVSVPKSTSILTPVKGGSSSQKTPSSLGSKQSSPVRIQAINEAADATVLSSKPSQTSDQQALAEKNHIAGASFGFAGLLAMLSGLAIWKKQTN